MTRNVVPLCAVDVDSDKGACVISEIIYSILPGYYLLTLLTEKPQGGPWLFNSPCLQPLSFVGQGWSDGSETMGGMVEQFHHV